MHAIRILRGRISNAVGSIGKLVRATVNGVAGEEIPDVEQLSGYGFSSVPKDGTECIMIRVGEHQINITGADRSIIPGMEKGDVCVHSDTSQYMILKADGGIDIRTSQQVTVYATQIKLGDDTLLPVQNGVVVPSCACSYAGLHLQGSATVMAKG